MELKDLPYWIDALRIWPRAMISIYLWVVVYTALWFISLVDPSAAQAGYATGVLGVGAAWFGIYVKKPPSNKPND